MALDADFERAVRQRAGDAEHDVPVVDLAIVEGDLLVLVDLADGQFGCAGDAAAVTAPVRQIHPVLLQRVEQRPVHLHDVRGSSAVGDDDGTGVHHNQMSLVQSPPG